MQMKFSEIMDMIKRGELHYNQSTQRKFVYNSMPAIVSTKWSSGTTTKSGSLINAILEDNVQLPALYFWHNTEKKTERLNIHDGKQRILSLYYFVNPTPANTITTIRNNKQTTFDGLSEEDQNKILNYTFDVVERFGNDEEEERSFFLINTNSVPLTPYECLSGMFHGTFLSGFETYIDEMSKKLDNVKRLDRGEQAYKFLMTMFDIADCKKASNANASRMQINDRVRAVRETVFDPTDYSFDKILTTFNDLSTIVNGMKEENVLYVASYIVRKGYPIDDVVDFYRASMRRANDMKKWDLATHKTFIDAHVLKKVDLDPMRNFSDAVKNELYEREPRCCHINEDGTRCRETSYSNLTVDHITPWSLGGETKIDNAQLLCRSHNSSKGNRG